MGFARWPTEIKPRQIKYFILLGGIFLAVLILVNTLLVIPARHSEVLGTFPFYIFLGFFAYNISPLLAGLLVILLWLLPVLIFVVWSKQLFSGHSQPITKIALVLSALVIGLSFYFYWTEYHFLKQHIDYWNPNNDVYTKEEIYWGGVFIYLKKHFLYSLALLGVFVGVVFWDYKKPNLKTAYAYRWIYCFWLLWAAFPHVRDFP